MTERLENTLSKNYANIVVTIIAALVIMMLTKQADINSELIRLKTVQDIDLANMDKLTTRVITLERDNIAGLQKWVEENYVRKPQ